MTQNILNAKDTEVFSVGMGQIAVVSQGQIAQSVLGSCIGLALYDDTKKVAALAHIVLADSRGMEVKQPGKFADTAVPHMIELLRAEGVPGHKIKAKVAGGANMFGSSGPMQIGKINFEAVTKHLQNNRIPIEGEHVGGDKGRRIELDSATCKIKIENASEALATI